MKFRVPLGVKLAVLVLGTTALYTYIGQLVPQKMVLAPVETKIKKDATTEEMIQIGRGIAEGKGLCLTCHTVTGKTTALRFPDLQGIGSRAAARVEGLDDVGYLAQSLYEPDSYIVEGFSPGMPTMNKPPIDLSDEEILTVIAYLQSLGGTPTVTMDTVLSYAEGN